MPSRDQLLKILDRGQQAQDAFVSQLSDEQRSATGTYERWSAKDMLAHVAHWKEQRAVRLEALASGKEPPASRPDFEQANAECFERHCGSSWAEVLAFAERAQARLARATRRISDEVLVRPLAEGQQRLVWEDLVGTAYTHPLMHLAEFYVAQGKHQTVGRLWQEWAELVGPLDDRPEALGLVHYNMACGLALSGNTEQAVTELTRAIKLRPSLLSWSKDDPDLRSLRGMPAYRELYAPEHWWKAMDSGPLAEAMADQFRRALSMFRQVVLAFPAGEWRLGDTPYQRPAGLALHLVEAIDSYSALRPGQASEGSRLGIQVDWQVSDSSLLPSQEDILSYLDAVDRKLADFLAEAELMAAEELFRWTGATLLSRAAYALRHTQHHLAEMALELHRRDLQAPDWE
jgi:tetratricopeptide (TPR) repeat protein